MLSPLWPASLRICGPLLVSPFFPTSHRLLTVNLIELPRGVILLSGSDLPLRKLPKVGVHFRTAEASGSHTGSGWCLRDGTAADDCSELFFRQLSELRPCSR